MAKKKFTKNILISEDTFKNLEKKKKEDKVAPPPPRRGLQIAPGRTLRAQLANYLRRQRRQHGRRSAVLSNQEKIRGREQVDSRRAFLEELSTDGAKGVLRWFPRPEQHKVYTFLQFVRRQGRGRIMWDDDHRLILDGSFMQGTNIIDILKFLYGIGNRYQTQLLPLIAPQGGNLPPVGIPKGTQELIDILSLLTQDQVEEFFNFDESRLCLLYTSPSPRDS